MHLGQPLIYIDDERVGHAGWVIGYSEDTTAIHAAYITQRGRIFAVPNCNAAIHDGANWRILNRYFFPPQHEYDTDPKPTEGVDYKVPPHAPYNLHLGDNPSSTF